MIQRITQRRGFTLAEMLVVIGIIAILAALVTVFVFSGGDSRRRGNTELTIQTVNRVLQQHWAQVIADAKAEDISDPTMFNKLQTLAGGPALDPRGDRAKVIWVKLRLMEAFPQSFAEVNLPANPVNQALVTYIPQNRRKYSGMYVDLVTKQMSLQTYNKYLNKLPAALDPATESSACLLMALSVARTAAQPLQADQIKYAVADTDGDGINEIVDGWTQPSAASPLYPADPTPLNPGKQHPLRFYRFAWNATIQTLAPNVGIGVAAGAANPSLDPVDNKGLLLNPGWYAGAASTYVQRTFCAIKNPAGTTNYIIPVIASAGSDGFFGLVQDTSGNLNTSGQLNYNGPANDDNIYSFNLRNQ